MMKIHHFLLCVLLLGCEAHLNDMFLTCKTHAGCEIFDHCTETAIAKLRSEVDEVVDAKLKKSNESLREVMKSLQNNSHGQDAIQPLAEDLESLMDRKISDLHQTVNETISNLQKLFEERRKKERNELDAILDEKVEEKVTKMTISVKKAQGEIDKASKLEIEELRDDTQNLVNARFEEISQRWTTSLGQAKINLTDTIDREMTTLDRRVRELEAKFERMTINISTTFQHMNNEINEQLQRVVKDTITPRDVELIVDAKFKEASYGWGSGDYSTEYDLGFDSNYLSGDYADLVDHETSKSLCEVSYGEKCFWIVEPSLAVSLDRAEFECKRKGGSLGNIYNKDHLEMLKTYLKSLINEKRMYFDAWTGMKIDPMSKEVTFTNGSTSEFQDWEPGSPAVGKLFPTWTGIYLIVKKKPDSIYQGMVNSDPESIRDGVLCEI